MAERTTAGSNRRSIHGLCMRRAIRLRPARGEFVSGSWWSDSGVTGRIKRDYVAE
jgi:hypothetical protein